MAQHDIAKEIMEIAELRGQEVEEVIFSIDEDNIDDFGDGEIIAWNRRTERKVKSELEKARKEATRKQVKESFHWVKTDSEWLVKGDFEGKEIGDIIEVYRVDGTSEEKVIVEFAVDADVSGLVRVADLNERLDIPRREEVEATEETQEENSEKEEKEEAEMKNVKINTEIFGRLGNWTICRHEIIKDEVKVGYAETMLEDDQDEMYLEDIVIYEEYRNQGIGTWTIHELAKETGFLFFAPTDEDNQRLYKRIAEEWITDTPEVDQGFGVYYLEV